MPSTSDELSEIDNSHENEDEFDDDYAVYGGNDYGVANPFPDVDSPPQVSAEKDNKDNQDADVEEEAAPSPRSKRRRGRKQRWLRNLLKFNPTLDAIVAAAVVPEQHADQVDKDALQQVVKE